jgi:glycine/D-amino acid oxidase-like deaminating enzyme
VVAEVKIEESCIYTLTPDRNPVIDIMPVTNNIVIAAGFSGNKTTSTLSSDQ